VRWATGRRGTSRTKVRSGEAWRLIRAVAACGLVTSFQQRNVDGESPACEVEDFGADGIAEEQVPEERIRPGGALRIIHFVVVVRDGLIPTGVGASALSSREPHGQ